VKSVNAPRPQERPKPNPPGASAAAARPSAAETIHFGSLPAPTAPRPPAKETVLFGSAGAVPARTPAPNNALHTQIFGKGSLPPAARANADASLPAPQGSPSSAPDSLLGLTLEAPRAPKVELPPAHLPFLSQVAGDTDEVEDLKPFVQRHRVALIITVVLALLAGLGTRFFTRRKPAVPEEAAAIHEQAISFLRRDDGTSKQEAVKALEQLRKSYPGFIQAKATLLLTLSLQWDDAQMTLQHNKLASEALTRKIAAVEEKKASTDWQNRVNAMNEQLRVLHAQESPLKERVSSLAKRAGEAFAALEPSEDLAVVRAQAVYQGVNASDQAVGLGEKYRSLGGTDGWDAIAYAEFVINAKGTPELAAKGRLALERLRAFDPAFVRAYLLGARLELQQNRYESAATLLDAAVALNPAHDAARRTLAWVQSVQQPEPDRLP
jgi:predicted negative regulator of RcsB-dependent stress response